MKSKIYYHYFEDPKYNGWFRSKYERFLGSKVIKIKLFRLLTIFKGKLENGK